MLARTLFRRSAPSLIFQRSIASTAFLRSSKPHDESLIDVKVSRNLEEATGPNALFGPGTTERNAQPSSFEIATGIDRLETLAKLEGIELFDMEPLKQDRKGTPKDPYVIDSFDRVRYIGCTGFPAGSQDVNWIRVEEGKIARDWESGCCYTLNYLGPKDDHAHH